MASLSGIPIGTLCRPREPPRPSSPERCSDLRARLLDTMMLLLATACFVHAHDVSQGRSRRASRRAVCLTPVIDAADAQKIMSTKAAREVLTTDAMNHLVSFGPCINSCRLPALAPIHSPCPEWSCNVCLYPAHLVHVLVASCVMSCVMSCACRLASVRLDLHATYIRVRLLQFHSLTMPRRMQQCNVCLYRTCL